MMKILAASALFCMAAVLVGSPTASAQNTGGYKKICYFANWPYYRNDSGKYFVEKLDPFECTHLMYGFAVLSNITYEMTVYDPWIDTDTSNSAGNGYKRFNDLRKVNPNLKTLIAVGGWNDCQLPEYDPRKWSRMVSDPAKRANFVQKALAFVKQYDFSGLDVDWEYPGDEVWGTSTDKANFVLLMQELSAVFKPNNLLLALAVSCSPKRSDLGYNIPEISKVADLINVMSYDIHGYFDPYIDHHAPLYRRPGVDATNDIVLSTSIDYWLNGGAAPEKLIFGIPMYGRTFTLNDTTKTTPRSLHSGPGKQGQWTGDPGFLSYYEICRKQQSGWITVKDPTNAIGPYTYGENQWVGWDDVEQVGLKVEYFRKRNLGGVLIWDITLDDFNNFCGLGARSLSKAIDTALTKVVDAGKKCTSEGQYYADPAVCSKYYRCSGGFIATLNCATNQAFNTNTNKCDSPQNVVGCNY